MQLGMVTVQGVFLDNVGESEALLHLPEHMKLNPLLSGWASPLLETRIRRPCLMGNRGVQCLKAAPVEVLLLLVDGPLGRGSVVMADIQHNVWVILLLELRKKLVKCYIWSIDLYGAETWMLQAVDQKHWKVLRCCAGEEWKGSVGPIM